MEEFFIMAKTKKLNLNAIKKVAKKYNKQKKAYVSLDGENLEFCVDIYFSPEKRTKLIQEIIQNINYLKDVDESVYISYILFLIIKYFSDINFVKENDFSKQISILTDMINAEVFNDIIDKFDNKEIEKLNNELAESMKRAQELVKELIKNKELQNDVLESEKILQITNDIVNDDKESTESTEEK